MRKPLARVLTGVALVGIGVVGGLVLSLQVQVGSADVSKTSAEASNRTADVPSSMLESPFVAVAERVVPGVVAIATRTGGGNNETSDSAPFHPWGDMFEDLFPNNPHQQETPRTPRRRQGGSGSGFLLDHDGYILTNNHVINKATEVTVTLGDGTELKAEIVGQDPGTDVALIKVDPKDYDGVLPVLSLGNSDDIRVGDWAVAVGNPFGQLAGSLTVGVVSAKGRQDLNIMGGTPGYQDFIQTDASINFGNSGGPLVNVHGDVIGVNTAINPAGQGIGFAIPINMASRIADELKTKGRVVRGYLGILPQALTPELAESLDIPGTEGILVGQVIEDTPAARGGLRRGDVITQLNGERLGDDVNHFRLVVAEQQVGEKIRLEVLREGKTVRLDVKLEERPDAPGSPAVQDRDPEKIWAGLRVEELDARESRRLFDEEVSGVLVTGVEPGSPADEAGVVPGDVIKEVGNMEVRELRDYRKAIDKYEDKKAVAILLRRGEQTLYVGVKP
ncbi:Do family serine endopeptidase [bacterium]|nr:Do family serine endopeptidase [bacterium]